jgi:hypothetical protein
MVLMDFRSFSHLLNYFLESKNMHFWSFWPKSMDYSPWFWWILGHFTPFKLFSWIQKTCIFASFLPIFGVLFHSFIFWSCYYEIISQCLAFVYCFSCTIIYYLDLILIWWKKGLIIIKITYTSSVKFCDNYPVLTVMRKMVTIYVDVFH